jgi:hypothetical protein
MKTVHIDNLTKIVLNVSNGQSETEANDDIYYVFVSDDHYVGIGFLHDADNSFKDVRDIQSDN